MSQVSSDPPREEYRPALERNKLSLFPFLSFAFAAAACNAAALIPALMRPPEMRETCAHEAAAHRPLLVWLVTSESESGYPMTLERLHSTRPHIAVAVTLPQHRRSGQASRSSTLFKLAARHACSRVAQAYGLGRSRLLLKREW